MKYDSGPLLQAESDKARTSDSPILKKTKDRNVYPGKVSLPLMHFKCTDCSSVFLSQSKLDQHLILEHIECFPKIEGKKRICLGEAHSHCFSLFPPHTKTPRDEIHSNTLKAGANSFRCSLQKCTDCFSEHSYLEKRVEIKENRSKNKNENIQAGEMLDKKDEAGRAGMFKVVNHNDLQVCNSQDAITVSGVMEGSGNDLVSKCGRCGECFTKVSCIFQHHAICRSADKLGSCTCLKGFQDTHREIQKCTRCTDGSSNNKTSGQHSVFESDLKRQIELREIAGTCVDTVENQIAVVSSSCATQEEKKVNSNPDVSHLKSPDQKSKAKVHGDYGNCIYCDKYFLSKQDYTNHLFGPKIGKPYQCCVCQRCFSYERCLRKHMDSHTLDIPVNDSAMNSLENTSEFVLSVLPPSVTGLDPMQIQKRQSPKMKRTAKSKPFECPICQKKFVF